MPDYPFKVATCGFCGETAQTIQFDGGRICESCDMISLMNAPEGSTAFDEYQARWACQPLTDEMLQAAQESMLYMPDASMVKVCASVVPELIEARSRIKEMETAIAGNYHIFEVARLIITMKDIQIKHLNAEASRTGRMEGILARLVADYNRRPYEVGDYIQIVSDAADVLGVSNVQ